MISTETSHFYTDVNGARIHYIEKPGDSGLTILLIHGRALSVTSWEKQFFDKTLSPFRMIALDLPGHGLSQRSDDINETYALDAYKHLLIGFIGKLKLDNYILAGLSLGGHIALQALPFLPGCKGVFAMTMPITKPMQPALMYQHGDVLERVYSADVRLEDVNRYIPILFSKTERQMPDVFTNAFFQTDIRIHEGIVNGIISGEYQDETIIIRNAAVPIAVVAGNEDQIHNLEYLDHFDLPVWSDTYHKVPDAGHLLTWEKPIQVNNLLKTFANDCFGS